MYEKYLNSNPVKWLLEDNNPSIKYLTLRDIIEKENPDEEYNSLLKIPEISKNINNGILGDTKHIDLYYKGTNWCFISSIEKGLNRV